MVQPILSENSITQQCPILTPEVLQLVELTEKHVERIASQVPGGVANIKDIYPLSPMQEGIHFHHLVAKEGDPYLMSRLMAFNDRTRLDAYLRAMQAVIDRHDILRTAIFWEDLPEPVQVVLRQVDLPIEEIRLEPDVDDAVTHLYARFDPRRYRIDLLQAPLLRVFTAYDDRLNRWLMVLLQHHLVLDNTSSAIMEGEIQAHLLGREQELADPVPFRNLVTEARLSRSREEHEVFFREMLGDVTQPTAPFGLLAAGDGTHIAEAHVEIDAVLSGRMRENARRCGVGIAALCHVAWALVLARFSGRTDVVFGTVFFGRMQSGEGVDCAMGPFINTLPLRIQIGEQSVRDSLRHTHSLLLRVMRHEHASLVLAQRCSAVPARVPLFSALLNYRSRGAVLIGPSESLWAQQGIERIRWETRTNYPFVLSIDNFGTSFRLTAQVDAAIDPMRICDFMQVAFGSLVAALEQSPETALRDIDVMPAEEQQLVLYGWNATEVK